MLFFVSRPHRLAAMIRCTHSGYHTPCQLRRRPGDVRKACWKVCHNCGLWRTCPC